MQLSTYLRALRKSWWIIVLMFLLGIAGGVAKNAHSTPIYASTLTFYVSTPGSSTTSNQLSGNDQFAERRANSYVELLSSERLAELIIADTRLPVKPGAIMGEISASAPLNTVLVKATVMDPSKQRGFLIAQSVASQFPGMVDRLDNAGLAKPAVELSVVSGPTLHNVPVSPRKNLNLALGIGVGLIVGIMLAIGRELMDTTVRSPAMLQELFSEPMIGTIPFDASVHVAPLIVGGQARSARAEAMRQIRTSLQFVDVDSPPQVILVTSSTASEGKSTTATNLALAFAETDLKVLLIEADMRRPRVTDYLGVERTVGLSNILANHVELDLVLQSWGDNLKVLPSGPTPPNAPAMLGSQRMAALISTLRSKFDIVIIDTPPVLPVTDAALVATLTDGVVMVARHGKVTRTQLTTAVQNLTAVNANILGFVLNAIPRRQAKEYGGRYDGYGYQEDSAAPLDEPIEEQIRSTDVLDVMDIADEPRFAPDPGRVAAVRQRRKW